MRREERLRSLGGRQAGEYPSFSVSMKPPKGGFFRGESGVEPEKRGRRSDASSVGAVAAEDLLSLKLI